MYWWISAASACADCRSWPNGFSTTTRAFLVTPLIGEAFDHRPEQERRDLQVEDRSLGVAERSATRA